MALPEGEDQVQRHNEHFLSNQTEATKAFFELYLTATGSSPKTFLSSTIPFKILQPKELILVLIIQEQSA